MKSSKLLLILLVLCAGVSSNSFGMNSTREVRGKECIDDELFKACEKGDLEVVKKMIHKGEIDINKANKKEGDTPLILACRKDNYELVKLLLDSGAKVSVNQANKQESTPLICACYESNCELVKLLLDNGATASINKADKQGNTPLINVCYSIKSSWRKDYKLVKLLLDNGAKESVNQANKRGDTFLTLACLDGNYKLVKLLLHSGAKASINKADKNGKTPLAMACRNNNYKLVKLLLDNGAKASINKTDKRGNTPLINVCDSVKNSSKDNYKLVKLLLHSGAKASINKADKNGNTSLAMACRNNNYKLVKLLLDNGAKASINKANKNGKTPLTMACGKNNCELVNLLKNGDTPLIKNNIDMGNFIINYRINEKVKEEFFLKLCEKKEFLERDLVQLKFLLESGFVFKKIIIEKDDFVHITLKNRNKDFFVFLLGYGAKISTNNMLINMYGQPYKGILKAVKICDEKSGVEKAVYIVKQIKNRDLFDMLVKRCFALSEKAFLVDKKEFGKTAFIKLYNTLHEKKALEDVSESIKDCTLYQECLKSYFLLRNNMQKDFKKKIYIDIVVKTD